MSSAADPLVTHSEKDDGLLQQCPLLQLPHFADINTRRNSPSNNIVEDIEDPNMFSFLQEFMDSELINPSDEASHYLAFTPSSIVLDSSDGHYRSYSNTVADYSPAHDSDSSEFALKRLASVAGRDKHVRDDPNVPSYNDEEAKSPMYPRSYERGCSRRKLIPKFSCKRATFNNVHPSKDSDDADSKNLELYKRDNSKRKVTASPYKRSYLNHVNHSLKGASVHVSEHGDLHGKPTLKTLNSEEPLLHKRRKLSPFSSHKMPTSSNVVDDNYNHVDHLIELSSAQDDDDAKSRKYAKNLFYERERRRKINANLYALRALVPKISKLDKASIVKDAIDYVQSLEKQVSGVYKEIQALSSWGKEVNKRIYYGHPTNGPSSNQVPHKILKVHVTKVEEAIYELEIICLNGKGVIANLTKALDSMQIDILNANIIAIDNHIINTIFVEAGNGIEVEPKELRDTLLRVALMFGLEVDEG